MSDSASYMVVMRRLFSHCAVVLFVLVGVAACTATGGRLPPGSHAYPGQVHHAGVDQPLAVASDSNLILKLATVEQVSATYESSPAPHARVVISGTLNDGATRIHDIRQQRIAGGVTLSVITARPRDAVASLAIIPFERVTTVDLQGQSAGPFSISANGMATTVVVP